MGQTVFDVVIVEVKFYKKMAINLKHTNIGKTFSPFKNKCLNVKINIVVYKCTSSQLLTLQFIIIFCFL